MFRTVFISSIAIFLFLIQCTMDPAGTNPEQNSEPGQMLFKLNMSEAPADVAGLSGRLSRDGQDTLFFEFELKDGYATARIEDLAAGVWQLEVDAWNAEGTVIYNGSTAVTVEPGIVTQVYLNLNPTTGSLEIVVTWGDVPFLFDSLIVAYYPFENSLVDLSRYHNHGIEHGNLTFVPGVHGQAVYFDGFDDFIEIMDAPQYNLTEKTISFWFYKRNDSIRDTPGFNDGEGLVYKSWDTGLNRDFSFTIGTQQPPFTLISTIWDGTDSLTFLREPDLIYPREWYFVTLVIGLEKSKLYLNSELIHTESHAKPRQNDAPIILGKLSYTSLPMRYFNGRIDDFVIINKKLSAGEIQHLYNNNF